MYLENNSGVVGKLNNAVALVLCHAVAGEQTVQQWSEAAILPNTKRDDCQRQSDGWCLTITGRPC